jgi:hypothetical protein
MNADGPVTPEERLQLRNELRDAMADIPGVFLADEYPHRVSAGALRRAGPSRAIDRTRILTLVEVGGVLFWEAGAGQALSGAGRRRGLRSAGRRGEIVQRVRVEELEPSKIGAYLSAFDAKLTPHQGLRRLDGSKLVPLARTEAPVSSGKILLLVHGTFSKGDMFVEELNATPEGKQLLGRAATHYKQILAFDHPTVSVSPIINALDLSRAFASSQAEIDIIAHSRGGLVTRWWLEALDHSPRAKRRAVLVGSPLAGTSLASPPRIRSLLSWFSNLNRVLSTGTAAGSAILPFLTVVSGLLRMTAAVTNVASRLPVADALIGLVPGVAAMSKISNNFELSRLNVDVPSTRAYFVVRSNFQTESPGWKFWKVFVDTKARTADAFTDLLFNEKNDLIVDTASMTYLSPVTEVQDICDFGDTDRVHHVNYFRQKQTIDFIAASLGI